MERVKYDGVLEAAHFKPDGQLDWVRVYEKRYSAFSDRILLSRADFIKQLKAGKHYMTGERIPYMGGKFSVNQPVLLQLKNSIPVIVVGNARSSSDDLSGVPIL